MYIILSYTRSGVVKEQTQRTLLAAMEVAAHNLRHNGYVKVHIENETGSESWDFVPQDLEKTL